MLDINKIIDNEKKFFDFYEPESEIPNGIKKLYEKEIDNHFINNDEYREINILDVGCGSGIIKNVFRNKKNFKFFGIDLSEKLLSQAKKKGYTTFNGDFLKNNYFQENFFDIIILHNSIHHLYDIEKTILVVEKLIKPKSLVLIFDPNGDSITNKFTYFIRLLTQTVTFNIINTDGIASKYEKNLSADFIKSKFSKKKFNCNIEYYSDQFLENKNRRIYSSLIGKIKMTINFMVNLIFKKKKYISPFFFLSLRN